MNREIKFRAWVDRKMINWTPTMFSDSSLVTRYSDCFPDHNDKSIILMQYTGLVDSNGVEVYEGDIIRIEKSLSSYYSYDVVVYDAPCFMTADGESIIHNIYYVVGNVYESPGLLGG